MKNKTKVLIIDEEFKKELGRLFNKVEEINERTKIHTKKIKELEKKK